MDSSDSDSDYGHIPLPPKKIKVKWNQVELSESKLTEEFRICYRRRLKCASQTTYYCAFGETRMKCPVRVKVKELLNGIKITEQNDLRHSGHRKSNLGLTSEQKCFVNDCVLKGVTKPTELQYYPSEV